MFADLDALIRNDAAQEPVIVAPATRRTDRSLPQCPRDATGCRRTRGVRMLQHDEETFRTVRANKLERLQGRQEGCAAWYRRGAGQSCSDREGGSGIQSRGMGACTRCRCDDAERGGGAALLPPRQQRTIGHRHILLVNSSLRSTLTRAFSISGRCRGKGTRRPINATYPAHHPARSSLWDGRYSEGPDWPAPLRDAGLSMRVVSK